MSKNNIETQKFLAYLKMLKIEPPALEHHIYIKGKAKGEKPCRIDFCWPDIRLAVEIEGGVWSRGRHVRGAGYIHDMKKYNWLSKNGWTLLRYTWSAIDYMEIQEVYKDLKRTIAKLNEIK